MRAGLPVGPTIWPCPYLNKLDISKAASGRMGPGPVLVQSSGDNESEDAKHTQDTERRSH